MQTQDTTPGGIPRHADGQNGRYDTDLIKSEPQRLLAAYLGQPGSGDKRVLWQCPRCGKQDKLSLLRSTGVVGCWNAGCELPDGTDVIGLIAHLEGLQTRGEDFRRVAALCYELLNLPAPEDDRRSPGGSPGETKAAPASRSRASSWSSSWGPSTTTANANPEQDTSPLPTLNPDNLSESPRTEDPDTTDQVLGRLLELCPREERDERFLASRGVALATARAGRYGSISAERASHVVGRLEKEFEREELLNVPGFREDARHGGRIGFTLWGDFLLIPYLDSQGRVVTIEGRAVGKVPKWAGKYTSLRNGRNHLYMFPGFRAEDLLAYVEGPLGPVVAAQEGIPVGGIQGVKRYTAAGVHAPLPELAGVDFGGRGLLYIPDADVKPDAIADVEKHAPKACEWLISRQNGVPRIATVPAKTAASDGALKDLDEWILAAPEAGFQGILHTLLSRSAVPEEWAGVNQKEAAAENQSPQNGGSQHPVVENDKDEEQAQVGRAEASEDGADGGEPADDGPTEDGTGEDEPEKEAVSGPPPTGPVDAFDRWHAVVDGHPGAKYLVATPKVYRADVWAEDEAEGGYVPSGDFLEGREVEWAGLLGIVAAVLLWYLLGAYIGWLPGPFGWLPDPPGPVAAFGGIPVSLAFGLFFGVVVLFHLRGRRLAGRAHLLGEK